MRFFGRKTETAELLRIREASKREARMTVVTGRRRVGKTELIRHALDDGKTPFVYFLITRAPQSAVCENLQREIARVFGRPMPGRIDRFADIFRFVLEKAETMPLTLVVDEFQEFDRTAPEVYGEVAGIWDELHKSSRVNLIFCGSVNRLMHKVFFSYAEPLYGRNTGRLDLKPFPASTFKEIFAECAATKRTSFDLLDLWTMTGGVARYVELFMDSRAFTRTAMLKTVFGPVTTFVDEGKTVLIEEFGRDYGTYFAILAGIASGRTTFAELKNLLGTDIGGYLTKLERDHLPDPADLREDAEQELPLPHRRLLLPVLVPIHLPQPVHDRTWSLQRASVACRPRSRRFLRVRARTLFLLEVRRGYVLHPHGRMVG